MSSAYQLKPWTQVAIPHQDILDGKLDNSVYAAKMGAVVRQDPNCPPLYSYDGQFFATFRLTSIPDVKKYFANGIISRLNP